MSPLTAFAPLGPELVVVGAAFLLLMYGVARPETTREAEVVGWLALAALVAAGVLIVGQTGSTALFDRGLLFDPYSRFLKLLALVGAGGALLLAFEPMREARILKFEYAVLILLATAGMMLMISANDLMALYLGLELQSLALYVVAAFNRENVRSSEAGLKYFVLGALSSGMLLYGASLVYGMTGTTSFAGIAAAAKAAGAGQNLGLIFGLVFLMVGLAFKVSAVPFHMWTPDVYEGAPTPVTAFLAAAPKVAAMALLVRVLEGALPGITPQWQQIVVFLAIASMVLGAFAAIGQTNIKRLMAYSSIGHMGYALVGVAAGTAEGVQGVLVYLAIYVAMTLGTFACVISMRRADGPVEDISALAGLSKTSPAMAYILAALLFSLAGIPPLAGFFAKFYVFLAAMKAGGALYYLAIIGVVASVVGAYYYLRIVKIMFMDEPAEGLAPVRPIAGVMMALAALFVVLYTVWPAPLVNAAGAAAKSLF